VDYVCFSPLDPKYLISISDRKIWQWDISGQQVARVLDGSHMAFSLDGTQFVMCNGSTIEVQSSDSKEIMTKLYIPIQVRHLCLSPDNRVIAVTGDTTIYIWDIINPGSCPLDTFIGHTTRIGSIVFSSPSSLISTSQDKSVKFWCISASSKDPDPANIKSMPSIPAPIKSITLQAKDSIAISSHSDGVVRIWDISAGICKASFQIPAKDSHWIDTQMTDGRLISVWCTDEKIWIWDTEKGKLLRTVDTPKDKIKDLRISGDGSKFFCLCYSSIQAWSIWTGESVGKVGFNSRLSYDAFLTIDGSGVWVHPIHPESILGWNFGILGSSPAELSYTSKNEPPLDFIGGIRMRRSFLPGIQDTVTGKVFFQLPERLVRCVDAQWDGQYLVVGYNSGEVLILECTHVLN